VVPGEGTWTVDNSGNVTFTPLPGFNEDPTPILYSVQDTTDLTSNRAYVTVDYVPIASDDSSPGNPTGSRSPCRYWTTTRRATRSIR
jgi:hypothetical protein